MQTQKDGPHGPAYQLKFNIHIIWYSIFQKDGFWGWGDSKAVGKPQGGDWDDCGQQWGGEKEFFWLFLGLNHSFKRFRSNQPLTTLPRSNTAACSTTSSTRLRQWLYYFETKITLPLSFQNNISKSSNYQNFVDQAKTMFKELDPTNDLTFLRIRTKVILLKFLLTFKFSPFIKNKFFRSMRSWWLRIETTCLLWFKTPRMPRHAFIILPILFD